MIRSIRRRAEHRESRQKKRRITLSLSRRSVQFLDNMRSEINAPSTSALVERIIDDLQGKAELEKIDAQLKAHYDSRPERSIQEDQTWGTIGESTLESIADDESSVRRASIASER